MRTSSNKYPRRPRREDDPSPASSAADPCSSLLLVSFFRHGGVVERGRKAILPDARQGRREVTHGNAEGWAICGDGDWGASGSRPTEALPGGRGLDALAGPARRPRRRRATQKCIRPAPFTRAKECARTPCSRHALPCPSPPLAKAHAHVGASKYFRIRSLPPFSTSVTSRSLNSCSHTPIPDEFEVD